MKKIKSLILGNYIVFIFSIFLFILYIVYIQKSTENIIYQDQFEKVHLNFISNYFEGKLSFKDLWASDGGHRLLGYHTITLINAIFFKLNTQIEMYLGAVILLIACILLYTSYQKSLKDISDPKFIQLSFLLISIILFSLNQWENIVFGMGLSIIIPILSFLITFLLLEKILLNYNFSLFSFSALWFLLAIASSVLIFGIGYSFGLIGSIIIVLFMKIFIFKDNFVKNNIKVLLFVSFSLIIFFSIYFYKIYENPYSSPSSFIKGLSLISQQPINTGKFILLALSASIFGNDFSNQYLSRTISLIIGGLLLVIYVYVLKKYISLKIYSKTYLPLFFIFHSLIIIGLTLLARLSYGVDYGMASRYTTHTQLGLIGIIWIIIFSLFCEKKNVRAFNKITALSILMFILFGQILTNIVEWKISPYRKLNYEKMRHMAISPEEYAPEDFKKMFQTKEDLVFDGLKILKKYELNVFHDYKIGSTLETAIPIKGWYEKEGVTRWISKHAAARFKSGEMGKILLEGYIPIDIFRKIYNNSLQINIFADDKMIQNINFSEENIKDGLFHIEADVPTNKIIKLEIKLDKSFIPLEHNLGIDKRELGIVINDIQLK
jgi:hypothetical protein